MTNVHEKYVIKLNVVQLKQETCTVINYVKLISQISGKRQLKKRYVNEREPEEQSNVVTEWPYIISEL